MPNIYRIFICRTIIALCMISAASFTLAQNNERKSECNPVRWNNFKGSAVCEGRERILSSQAEKLSVDGHQNGSIVVKGWGRKETFIRAQVRVWSQTKSQEETRIFASKIKVDTSDESIHAVPPSSDNNFLWSVDYEISLPFDSNLSLKTFNGAIQIADVRGQIKFDSLNGAISLSGLAGEVRGQTVNGALNVKLSGERWEGAGLDTQTINGRVFIEVPENYSARLETSTKLGGLNVNFPLDSGNDIRKELAINFGRGGATVRAVTVNGDVSVKRGT